MPQRRFRSDRRSTAYISRERAIEDFIIAHPDLLGFPRALAVRNMRVHLNAGLIDVALLPVPLNNPIKLVLVEAKVPNSADASSKVIGQLLMYYAGALKLGIKGLKRIRRFAKENVARATDYVRVSPKLMTGGVSPPQAAWAALEHGDKLRFDEVALFIAIEDEPRESLVDVVKLLRCHGLEIGIFSVAHGLIDLNAPLEK
jgi:hypothetical protein